MASHKSHGCRRFGYWTTGIGNHNGGSCNRIVGIDNQSGGSDDWIADDHCQSGISGDRTANTHRKKGIFGHQTFGIGCDAASLATRLPTLVVDVASSTIEPPTLIVGKVSPTTELLAPDTRSSELSHGHQTTGTSCRNSVSGYQTGDLDWGGEATVCFLKMFYQIFKGKTFYNFLQKILRSTENNLQV